MALLNGDIGNFAIASTPGGIEAQEKAGQMAQALKETLPIDGTIETKFGRDNPRATWEKLGFKFGKKTEDIFVECTFPKGWKKQETDHSMWTDLLDEHGRKRAAIFYKAAFYDRSAHVSLCHRFGVRRKYPDNRGDPLTVYVEDQNGEVSREIADLPQPDWKDREESKKLSDRIDAAEAELRDWLTAKFPDWGKAWAYWDTPPVPEARRRFNMGAGT
jgi:hypothetical protein